MQKQWNITAYIFILAALLEIIFSLFTPFALRVNLSMYFSLRFFISLIVRVGIIVSFGWADLAICRAILNKRCTTTELNKLIFGDLIVLTVLIHAALAYSIFFYVRQKSQHFDFTTLVFIARIFSYIPGSNLFFSLQLLPRRLSLLNIMHVLENLLIVIGLLRFSLILEKTKERLSRLDDELSITTPLSLKPAVGFVQAIKNAFLNYFSFSGCATRSEYWWFFLALESVFALLGFCMYYNYHYCNFDLYSLFMMITIIFFALTALPAFSINVRRAHDMGLMGIFSWIPFFGLIVSLAPSNADSKYRYGVPIHPIMAVIVKILVVLLVIVFLYRFSGVILYLLIW
ncbi:MAG: DUF805 domain-containing protein [Treponema sp.]|nr:DUF805 domain-containing protein [Treponema sp.]